LFLFGTGSDDRALLRRSSSCYSIVENVPTSTVKLDPTHLHILHFSPPHEFPALPLPPHLATMYSTHTYKTISSSLSLSADVYLPAPSAPSGDAAPLLPVLAWFHGGGLLMGSRSSIPPHLLRAVRLPLPPAQQRLTKQRRWRTRNYASSRSTTDSPRKQA
jgi:hypothetical protein